MSTTVALDQIVDDYLQRLETALGALPESRRQQLLDDVRAHIAEERARLGDPTEQGHRQCRMRCCGCEGR